MLQPKTLPAHDEAATRILPGIEAGRTVPFEDVAAELRRNYGKA